MKKKILIIDDDKAVCRTFSDVLGNIEYDIEMSYTGKDAQKKFEKNNFDLIFCDLNLPDINGIDLIKKIKTIDYNVPIIMITAYASIETAVNAIKYGAFDYIEKPFDLIKTKKLMKNVFEAKSLISSMNLIKPQFDTAVYGNLIGEGKSMQKIFEIILKIANVKSTVMITGESGTGKEQVARAIHLSSIWKNEPFVSINCSAIPENLLESELFGYEKGAFTGAVGRKPGKFNVGSEGGTLLLDEIGNMKYDLQSKILTVIETKMITPLGSNEPIPIDIRIMSATNSDIEKLVCEKKFREDLYYRLNIIRIKLTPLRERKEDIPALVNYFIDYYNNQLKKNFKCVDEHSLEMLKKYNWPGNIRQLKHAVEKKMIFTDEHQKKIVFEEIDFDEFPKYEIEALIPDEKKSLAEIEKEHIIRILKSVNGNKGKASEILGIDRSTLYLKIKNYNITE